jgi:hypothetical protein
MLPAAATNAAHACMAAAPTSAASTVTVRLIRT